MNSDDKSTPDDPKRKKLLEEIRRRAEEAELKRLENEDQNREVHASGPPKERSLPPPSPKVPPPSEPPLPPPRTPKATETIPVPAPHPEGKRVSNKVAQEQKVIVLRERLMIALDRKRVPKAAELLTELAELVPDDPDIDKFRARLEGLKEEKHVPREQQSAQTGKAPQVAVPAQEEDLARIPELLDAAHANYQQEKYAKALECIDEVLKIEPDNGEAVRLREAVNKAKQISELISKEEAKFRAGERDPSSRRKEGSARVAGQEDKDFWGTETSPLPATEFELAPKEAGPVAPPKPPLVQRIAIRIPKIKIPWKPILSILIVAGAALAGYYIVDYITQKVSPPVASILVIAPDIRATDTANAYIIDGLVEDLIGDLSLASGVRIINASSVLAYRASPVQSLVRARSLRTGNYLQWDASWASGWLVTEARLYDTVSTKPLWVSRNQGALGELPALRAEMARRILAAMKIELEAKTYALLRRVPGSNPAAIDAYLRGRAVLRQPETYAPSVAVEYFTSAARADSLFPEAQSALGWSHILDFEEGDSPARMSLTQALACVQRAVLLEWKGPETFRVWGMVDFYNRAYEKSLEHLEAASLVAPSDAETLRRLSAVYLLRGQYDPAVQAAERAVSNDPQSMASHSALAYIHHFVGQYVRRELGESRESRAAFNAAAESYATAARLASDRSAFSSGLYAEALSYIQQPDQAITLLADRLARARDSYMDYYRLARIQQAAGKPQPEWQEALFRARALINDRIRAGDNDPVALSYLALVHTRLGQFKEAASASSRAVRDAGGNVEVLYNTAQMYSLQQNPSQALQYLNQAIRSRFSLPRILDMDFYVLRSHPGFLASLGG